MYLNPALPKCWIQIYNRGEAAESEKGLSKLPME